MFGEPSRNSSEVLVSAGFYEVFTAANAIRELKQVGFEDDDIHMVGVLAGPVTGLARLCRDIGLPAQHALYYETSFDDGGVLLVVRARESFMKKTAQAVLNAKGGILPPTTQ
jgi:hypoxanthine-guanine phosphoribosyltransferase